MSSQLLFRLGAAPLIRGLGMSAARNPLACVALAAMAGIVVVDTAGGPWSWWLCFALALLSGVWVCWRPARWRLWLLATAVFGFLHACRLDATRDHVLTQWIQPGDHVDALATGTFTRAPMIPDATTLPGRREARFKAERLTLPSRGVVIEGATELRVWITDAAFVPVGGIYELHGTLHLPSRSVNPGLYDPQRGAMRQGIVADLLPREIQHPGPAQFSLRLKMLAMAERSRQWIASAVTRGIEDDEMPSALIRTMALGISEAAGAELREPFQNSGTLHVFAVSGLHVIMLSQIILMIFGGLSLPRRWALLLLIPLIIGYAFITGWRPSAARAALMTVAMICAPAFNRRSHPVNALGGCALLLLAADTHQLFQAGFQLSFGVVWLIAVTSRRLTRVFARFAELDPFLPPQLAGFGQRLGVWVRREVISMGCVSIVAFLGSLPVMILQFHNVTPISMVANGVLVPLAMVSLFAVVLSLICGWTGLGALQVIFNNANWLLAHGMTASATWFASIPGGNFAVALPVESSSRGLQATLSVLAMPPGEGAQMLESQGQRWLLDCGGAKHEATSILPFLKERGINSLEGIVLSHAESGHIGAMSDLMPRFHPPQVMMAVQEPWRLDSRITLMHQLFAGHALDGARLTKLQAGSLFTVGVATVHVLYPTPDDLYNKADDRAIVARIDCGRMRLLWCNDAGFITEKHLLARLPKEDLRSQVLIRNQHASDYSALPEFLLAVAPKLVITSNAPGILEQRVPEYLTTHCQQHGITLFDQSETGLVKLDLWPDHLEASAWLTGKQVTLQP